MIIELIQAYPKISVILIGLAITLFITIVNYFVLDKARLHEIKARQKAIQEEMKHYKDDANKVMELQKEMMGHVGETMKHSLKPMIFTAIPILVIFLFIKGIYAETTLEKTWFWWYIGSSIIGSIVFRKLFKLP